MINEKTAKEILKTYEEAWVEQDADKIISIFAEDGTYQERVFEEPFKGHEEIRKYWEDKVVSEQSNIKFKLLNYYICGDTLIAEWDASFDAENKRVRIREVAILEIEDRKIKSFREYWWSE